jgi:anti-anti-sigma factor
MEVTTMLGPISVLSVRGDINSNTLRELVERADQVLNKGYHDLIIDLHEVNYISSGGLVAIQRIMGRAAERGGKTVLAGVTPRVAQVLDVMGFSQHFNIFPDVAAAQASFPRG